MFRFRFFIIALFLYTLFPRAYALTPAELHIVGSKRDADAGIISTSSSPFAKLHGIPLRAVHLGDGFWKKRFTVNIERSIPTFFTLLNDVGARDKLLGRKNKARGNSDADLAKWVEAASFALQLQDNRRLRDMLQRVVNDSHPLLCMGQSGTLRNGSLDPVDCKGVGIYPDTERTSLSRGTARSIKTLPRA